MPEVVSLYLSELPVSQQKAQHLARTKQKDLLQGITNDLLLFGQQLRLSKANAKKLLPVFSHISSQLQNAVTLDTTVQRFQFSSLGKHVTFSRVANVFDYLSYAGLIIRSYQIREPVFPSAAPPNLTNVFKCFFFDCGLLNAKLAIPYQALANDELSMYKGALAENFVAQQLYNQRVGDLTSWKTKNYEIEFLLEYGSSYVPVEVKSSSKSRSSASLRKFLALYEPKIAVKFAPRNIGSSAGIMSLPIYLVERLDELLS